MKILFQPDNKKCEINEEENLLKAAEKAGVLIDGSCGGAGLCGKCKVRIVSGFANDLTDEEERILSDQEKKEGYRLACKTYAKEDMVLELPGIHKGSGRKKNMTVLPEGFRPNSLIVKVHEKVKKPSMKDQRSDYDRIKDTFGKEEMKIDRKLLMKIHEVLDEKRGDVTAVFSGDVLIGLEAGDTSDLCYGMAFDIGTTTVVAMLWDLKNGELMDVTARTNPQSIYGADVISRIQYCNEGADHLSHMQKKILDCFQDMIDELTGKNQINPENIYDLTAVGNTTMSHLFLGVHPKSLARTPFAPVFCKSVDTPAVELGLKVNAGANLCFLPNIAGHVGADISAVLLATGLKQKEGAHIAIDIGTNGEILLADHGRILACSTAAGPAFEGAAIEMGMRAADGAIEKVKIEESEVKLQTIEGKEPIGICGSGLIDAVAALLKAGIVEKSGRMRTKEAALEANIPPELAERIVENEGKLAFILAYKEDGKHIWLTQQDIREVQLAKGAIYAGMKTMMKMIDLQEKDLDSIILAGAFGNYIDKESALTIGLLPAVSMEQIISVGNAAGVGACMALLSKEARQQVITEVKTVEHVELSVNMDFQEEYMLAMNF
ncbi:MAG: ASKHA domain-containing protein [Lachnospiraceae bacterium]|nr:ASKHA domain-containing protein [Lachnospiraceae bacterium]